MSAPAALRDLPPVEPVDLPSRFSMTLLRNFSRCQRSAYLYRKYGGGAPSRALDRGTAFHRFAETATKLLVEQGESQLPPEVAKDLMAETIARSEDLTVPPEEQEPLRVMAYHWAEGVRIDPSTVVAVEQLFALQVEEFTVVGKPDVVFRVGDTLEAWDYKSGYAMTAYDEIAASLEERMAPKGFQLLLYVLLMAYGVPMENCDRCDGQGTVLPAGFPPVKPGMVVEVDGDPVEAVALANCPTCDGSGLRKGKSLSDGVNLFRGYERYPMYLFDDGLGSRGPLDVERPELVDHRIMLEGLVFKLAQSFESWRFEAVPGSWCSECPARSECPLPERLRDHRGTIGTTEDAEEAAQLIYLDELDLKARKAELKDWANFDGPIRFGDRVFDFRAEERRSVDRDGLLEAAARAAEFGEPLDPDGFVKVSTSTRFSHRKVKPGENGAS